MKHIYDIKLGEDMSFTFANQQKTETAWGKRLSPSQVTRNQERKKKYSDQKDAFEK